MAEEKELTGWERSRAAQKGYGNFYAGLAIATVFIAGVWIGSRVFATSDDPNSSGFFLNLWTEALGILVTVGLFGLISKHLADERYKDKLVDEAASTSNEIAKHAIHVMRRRGWLEGNRGLLVKADLTKANLKEADLTGANLEGATLIGANLRVANLHKANLQTAKLESAKLDNARMVETKLQNADLFNASLQEAYLVSSKMQHTNLKQADMQRASLSFANLEEADLTGAKLQKANLEYVKANKANFLATRLENANLMNTDCQEANLPGVNLRGANLTGANFEGAVFSNKPQFSTDTILPDGAHWQPNIDIGNFTNRNHPHFFWREPFDSESPAYEIR